MDFQNDEWAQYIDKLTVNGTKPPEDVVASFVLTVAGATVRALLADRKYDQDGTTWRVAAMVGDGFVCFLEVFRAEPDWDAGGPDGHADSVTGWVRATSDFRTIRLDQIHEVSGGTGSTRRIAGQFSVET